MEELAESKNIATVVASMRPAERLSLLLPAFEIFEQLLGEMLLLDSTDPDADVEQLLHELGLPGIRECAETYVYAHEFGRIVATVAYYGPGPVNAELVKTLWPIKQQDQAIAVAEMVRLIQAALPVLALVPGGAGLRRLMLEAGAGWPVADGYQPPPRRRGRPKDIVQQSVVFLGVRESIFRDGARPLDEVAKAIANISPNQTTEESIYRQMKAERQEYPIPKGWQETLLCERVSPFRSEIFTAPADAPEADPPLVANWKVGIRPKHPR